MAMRMFCDACGTEITANWAIEPLTAERTFRPGGRVVKVKVTVKAATVDLPGPEHHLCRDCVIDTVNVADTRPKEMDVEYVSNDPGPIGTKRVG